MLHVVNVPENCNLLGIHGRESSNLQFFKFMQERGEFLKPLCRFFAFSR